MAATAEELKNALKAGTCSTFNKWDQVFPGIFLGNGEVAKSITSLKTEHITHVLNLVYIAPGEPGCAFSVGGSEEFYREKGLKITFKGLHLHDDPTFDISKYFDEAVEFIHNALTSEGRVLVHCYVGVSRAATMVLAYLMIKKGYSALEAVNIVSQNRYIYPNNGFIQQLSDLDSTLYSEGKRLSRVKQIS